MSAEPTHEEIEEAQREADLEDAEARGATKFIQRVRKYAEENHCSIEQAFLVMEVMQKRSIAVERAIKECIKEHRLEEYLTRNRQEVRDIMLEVPTYEEIVEAQREIDREEAVTNGYGSIIEYKLYVPKDTIVQTIDLSLSN